MSYYFISSEKRTSGTSTNFLIENRPGLTVQNYIELVSCSIPLNYYTIDSTNDQFYFNDGTARTGTLNHGIYDANSLAAEIQRVMRDVTSDNDFDVTYEPTLLKMRFVYTGSFTINWSQMSKLSKMLGFGSSDTVTNNHLSINAVSLQGHDYLFIRILDVGNNPVIDYINTGTNTNSFAIPLSVSGGEVERYLPETYQRICFSSPRVYTSLRIQLRGEDGELINLNGSDWKFLIRVC